MMMKKIIVYFLLVAFPLLATASGSSLSFTPPITDYSVIFLGNIFGVVDGVLHGTGSQILGQMFSVFNAAVLALGGIIIIYTLVVATLNTANEGQMLGKKWDSMWVPVRAILGLALLIPKASGYCVMQIFVMWLIIQGVGAADKIWNAGLNYLNRGGMIVPSQATPVSSVGGGNAQTATGAGSILASQVCMVGLEKVLKTKRKVALAQAEQGMGSCSNITNSTDPMYTFCNSPVPDLLNSVNAISAQTNATPTSYYSIPLPNLPATSPYKSLNGICGNMSWGAINASQFSSANLNSTETQTTMYSRAIAVQQLYLELSTLANTIVNNDPQITLNSNGSTTTAEPNAPFATAQLGVPYSASNSVCTSSCAGSSWGADPQSSAPVLLSGYEFVQAINDYNVIMQPTLNLIASNNDSASIEQAKSFINQAENSGWIMAGSYFFNLAQLNANAPGDPGTKTDNNSQLNESKYSNQVNQVVAYDTPCSSSPYPDLCVWMAKDSASLTYISDLIEGPSTNSTALALPSFMTNAVVDPVLGPNSSTAIGYVYNGSQMVLPGQPGLLAPVFSFKMPSAPSQTQFQLKPFDFQCTDKVSLIQWCATRDLGVLFWNKFLVVGINKLLAILMQITMTVINTTLFLPLNFIATIFKYAVSYIQQPNVNPIVALANMGTYFINLSNNMFIGLIMLLAPLLALIGPNVVVMGIVAITLPILMAWFAMMLGIGFLCAYYIPFVPYMIFTFGTIGWLMAVIEAMVAAPIIALGVTHPEGEGPFGKGEQALMILMNVFLRPSMMIIGYIASIILSYVAIYILNAGFGQVVQFISGDPSLANSYTASGATPTDQSNIINGHGYASWAGMYGFFFVILMYTSLYLIIVQRTFTLITLLPDKVLRWIGGQAESYGSDTAQWSEEAKGKIEKGGEEMGKAGPQTMKAVSATGLDALAKRLGNKKESPKVEFKGKE